MASWRRGSGHYALGRGHLSLHEHKRARVHLDEALRRGEKGPELYAALGRVLGELYHEALLEARRAGEKTWVEQRQKELQRELLDPATTALQRALLRKSELTLDAPDYIEGLLAYYGGRFPEADQKAQAALASDSVAVRSGQAAGRDRPSPGPGQDQRVASMTKRARC
jgi:hypothetical protein